MFAVNRNYTTYTYCTIIVIPPLHSTFWDLSPGCILLFLETSTLKNGLAGAPSKEELCYSLSFCFSETAVTEPFSCSLKLKKAFSFSILLLWIVTYLLLSMRSVLGNIDPRFWKYGPSTASLSKLTEGQYFPVWLKFITYHLPAYKEQKIYGLLYDNGNSLSDKLQTKEEPIRILGFTSRLLRQIIMVVVSPLKIFLTF